MTFYSRLEDAKKAGVFRMSVVSASDLGRENWRGRVRSVNVSLR